MRDKLLHVRNTEPGQPLQLEDGEWDGLTFRKELIYADDFHKRNATSNQKFTIDEMKLAHWEHVGNQMIADGVKVPTPLKHTDSPEANRGQIIRYERDTNSKGVPALYGVVKFRDAEAAKLANSTDISIFVPETPFYNGKGKKYEYGIRHVALTDYPVIPGLEGFVPIAASFDEFDSEPLELGLVSGAGKFLKDNSNRYMGTQLAGETVGENARTKNQHRVAAGLLGASAYYGGKEVAHIGKRFGKTISKQYNKGYQGKLVDGVVKGGGKVGGVKRVIRSLGTFDKITKVKAAPSTFSSVYTKAPRQSGKIIGGIGKVARAVGRRIPLIGVAGAAAGAAFGASTVAGGIQGAANHASKIQGAPNRKRSTSLSLEFRDMVQGLKQDLQLDFGQPERLELGGPGSGPQKGGLIKHNGLENRSVFDRIRMNVSKVKPHLQKIGRASANIAKNVAKSPLTRIAIEGEIANQAARKIRGDDGNRRLSAIVTTSGVRSVIKNAKAFVKYDQDAMKYADKAYGATKSSHTAFWGNKIKAAKAASSIHGAAAVLGTGLTSIAISTLLTKKKPKDKELSLGGPGSGPNVGQSRGTYRTIKKQYNILTKKLGRAADTAAGKVGANTGEKLGRSMKGPQGARVGSILGKYGAISLSKLAKLAAPSVVKGEGLNYLTKYARGDNENKRVSSYLTQAALTAAAKAKGTKRGLLNVVAAIGGLNLLRSNGSKHKYYRHSKAELSLGGVGSGPIEGIKRGPYNTKKSSKVAEVVKSNPKNNRALAVAKPAALAGAGLLGSITIAKHLGLDVISAAIHNKSHKATILKGLATAAVGGTAITEGTRRALNNLNGDEKRKVIAGALGAGGAVVVAKSIKPTLGLRTFYHGTSKVAQDQILKEGFKAQLGGAEHGASAVNSGKNIAKEAAQKFKEWSVGKTHVTSSKIIANGYAKAQNKPGARGKRIKITIGDHDFNKMRTDIHGTPKFLIGVTDKDIPIEQIHGSKATFKAKLNRRFLDIKRSFGGMQTKKGLAGLLVGASAIAAAASLLRKPKQKELSLAVVDAAGNHHAEAGTGKGGQFVAKLDGARSASSMRRRLNSLKPKKFHYEDIGNVPSREANEAPREYKARIRKLRNENKTENPNYYKDFSEEDVKDNSLASANQAAKHSALAAVGAGASVAATGGTLYAGKNIFTDIRDRLSEIKRQPNVAKSTIDKATSASKAAAQTTIDALKAHTKTKSAVTRGLKNRSLNAKDIKALKAAAVVPAAEYKAAKEAYKVAETKLNDAVKFFSSKAGKSYTTKLARTNIISGLVTALKKANIRKNLLIFAGASAAAAYTAHETKQHFLASKFHFANSTKKLRDFRNSNPVEN